MKLVCVSMSYTFSIFGATTTKVSVRNENSHIYFKMVQSSVLVFLSLVATSSGFLLEGLGLGGLGGGQRQCCCPPPPPPPPCGGGGYEAPPPPPPPPYATSYAGSYGSGPYKHRSKKSVDMKASSGDLFCNSVQVRDIIKKVSRVLISCSWLTHF